MNQPLHTPPASRLREVLETTPSPDPRHDYLVELAGGVGDHNVGIRYVPDRLVLTPVSLATYFAMRENGITGEELALAVLDDLANELVPRWIEVTVTAARPLHHRVVVRDRQPDWTGSIG